MNIAFIVPHAVKISVVTCTYAYDVKPDSVNIQRPRAIGAALSAACEPYLGDLVVRR
jgi:hypothetical protein